MFTIRSRGLQRLLPSASILPLLPWLDTVLQGREAAGVSVHSSCRPVLVVLEVLFSPGCPLLIVSLNVEICEEGNQGNHVSNLEIQPTKRERARPYDSTAGLDDCQHKLKQLPLSDVLLPPEIRTHGWHG